MEIKIKFRIWRFEVSCNIDITSYQTKHPDATGRDFYIGGDLTFSYVQPDKNN